MMLKSTDCGHAIYKFWNRVIIIGIIFFIVYIIRQLYFICAMYWAYGIHGIKEFVASLEFILVMGQIILVGAFYVFREENIDISIHFAAWMVFIVWSEATLLLAHVDIGRFVFILFETTYTILVYIAAGIPSILAFSFGFHILLYNEEQFGGYVRSYLYTFTMTVTGYYNQAEFDFDKTIEKGTGSYSAQIMYFWFLLFCIVIFMNVLVAVTVNSVKNLQNRGKYLQNSKRKKYIVMCSYLWKIFDLIPFLRVLRILESCEQNNSYTVRI